MAVDGDGQLQASVPAHFEHGAGSLGAPAMPTFALLKRLDVRSIGRIVKAIAEARASILKEMASDLLRSAPYERKGTLDSKDENSCAVPHVREYNSHFSAQQVPPPQGPSCQKKRAEVSEKTNPERKPRVRTAQTEWVHGAKHTTAEIPDFDGSPRG